MRGAVIGCLGLLLGTGAVAEASAQESRPSARQSVNLTRTARDAFGTVSKPPLQVNDNCYAYYKLPEGWTSPIPELASFFPRHAQSILVRVLPTLGDSGETDGWRVVVRSTFYGMPGDVERTVAEDRALLTKMGFVGVERTSRHYERLIHKNKNIRVTVSRKAFPDPSGQTDDEVMIYDSATISVHSNVAPNFAAMSSDPHVQAVARLPGVTMLSLERNTVPMRDYELEAQASHDHVWRVEGAKEAALRKHFPKLKRSARGAGIKQPSVPYVRSRTPSSPGVLVKRIPHNLIHWEYENPVAQATLYSGAVRAASPPNCR